MYGSWLGGSGTDYFTQLAMDVEGNAYPVFLAGSGIPVTPGAYQSTYAGSGDFACGKFSFDLLPWRILGGGNGGKEVPVLTGLGDLTQASSTRLSLRGAPASSPTWLVAGTLQLGLPFLGAVLIPLPTVIVPTTTDALGGLDFVFPWPSAPSGLNVFFQAWAPDPTASQGWAASNGLQALAQ